MESARAAPSEYHYTTLRVQCPYTLETHSTTITCTIITMEATLMNISSFNQTLNTSFDSTLGEFSHWRVTTAIILISRLLFSVPITLLINTSILVTILKTKLLRRPLNLIHLSLLTVNCLILIPDVILTSTFIPTILRYCECFLALYTYSSNFSCGHSTLSTSLVSEFSSYSLTREGNDLCLTNQLLPQ